MRSSLLLASGAAAAAVDLKLSGRAANASTSYLARMADTHIRKGIELDFGYTNAVIYQGLELAYEVTKNESIADAYEKQMSIINEDGSIKEYEYDFYSLDEYRFGMNALWWYNKTGEEKYKTAADGIRGMLDRHPRTPSGGFWHRAPIYENQMWLDGIFMADSFYAKYTSLYDNDNTTAWDDIVQQFDNIEKYTRNHTTNLLVHGYDESKKAVWADPETGAAPLVWSRAVGWYMVSLLETIPLIPASHEGKEKLTGYFQTLAEGVLKAQDAATSGWWLIMDFPGREKNYIESSASAMFTYSLLRGVRTGLIDAATYLEPAKKAYQALVDDFVVENADGTLDWEGTVLVGSLNSNATFEYYTSIALSPDDYKGVGPFMYASYEIEISPESPYGSFPRPNDAFRFLPCTNVTRPPALDDKDHEASWAGLFDPNPDHWSWGNTTVITSEDPYAGRGIFLCGYIDVPLDYKNESDTRITRLAVTKFQVSGLARADGSSLPGAGTKSERTLVLEPGGPGGSGTRMAWTSGELLTERFTSSQFDTLGWDPRGVNASQPAISCYPYDADRDRWSALSGQYREQHSDPETQLRITDAMNNATFHACWKRHGDLARFMTTTLVARDLEEIRKALGEDELTGYLVSYGTGIGQTYANMFPGSVGRIILDGTEYVRDHRLLGGFGWTALDNVTDAFHDGFLGECLNSGPQHCALARPHGGRPVVLEDLEKRIRALVTGLISDPVPGYTENSGPSLITYSALIGAIYGSMYNAKSWPALAEMLYELEAGNSTLATAFLELSAWEYDPTLPRLPSPRPSTDELTYLVICGDSYDAPAQGLPWWSSLWANMTSKSFIAGNSRFSAVFPCRHFATYWPDVAEVYRGPLNNTLKNPVLLIAETYDPATPLRNGRRLAAEMGKNARLIAHHGYGHSSRDLSNCTETLARAFVLNGTLPEEPETACYANEKPYLYGVKSNGVSDIGATTMAQDPVAAWREHILELAKWQSWLL